MQNFKSVQGKIADLQRWGSWVTIWKKKEVRALLAPDKVLKDRSVTPKTQTIKIW